MASGFRVGDLVSAWFCGFLQFHAPSCVALALPSGPVVLLAFALPSGFDLSVVGFCPFAVM